MLNRIPSPCAAAQSGTAAQIQRMPAKRISHVPISISDVIASVVKLNRLRKRPARRPVTTTPALPAANSTPTPVAPTFNRSWAKSTSCVKVVAPTKLISAIITEMFRSTGCASTYLSPSGR